MNQKNQHSKITSRTVIYEEPSTSTKTLKSSIRQVTHSTSSFYNTAGTSSTSNKNSDISEKPLTIRKGKQSTAINSDMYNAEIFEEEEEDDDHQMDYHHHPHQNKVSNDERTKRHYSSSDSSDSDEKSHQSEKKNLKRKSSSNVHRSPSEEGEEIESRSDESDDQRQSVSPNQEKELISNNNQKEEDQEQHDEVILEPGKSRFDDPQDNEEINDQEESDQDDDNHHYSRRHRSHHHRHHHHKKSRRHSSETPQSSSSKSALTPPIVNNDQIIEKEQIETKVTLPSYYPAIQGCRKVDAYKCLNRIEEGTYGVVFRAKDIKTDEIVALKRLKMEKEKEGFPVTSLREICCILKSQHENVCTVREIVVGDDMNRIFIVMDYVEHDLKSLMTHTMKNPFTIGQVKTLMHQLLSGVNHLHDNWIIHRDLKTSNLLLNNKGILKIGDFGLAREYGSPLKAYTPVVVTLWYRAPELLLGIKEYSTPIDIWSVGAIFGEFLLMKPLFPGKSELDQLNRIFKDLGTPNDKIWPDYSTLPFARKMNFAPYPYNHLKTRFNSRLSEKGFDLLNKFLTYDPVKRISASDALKHSYFDESPHRIDPSMFPTWPSRNEEKTSSIQNQRSLNSNSATIQNEPKPPSAGKMYEKLLGGEDDDDSVERNLPPPSGFQLHG